jgi:alkylation response protein AidB-like acyl-CoA dehydrogenase
MHFDLSDEQKMLRESVNDFLTERCSDAALMQYVDAERPVDTVWAGLCELGLPSALVPQEHGGLGLDMLTQAVIAEACGYHALPGPLLQHAVLTLAIVQGGDAAQRERWLPALARGELVGTVAFAEAPDDGRWEPAQWTFAGDRLDGSKHHVVDASSAHLLLVGLQGGGLGVVETRAAGVRVEPYGSVDRTRRLHTVHFAQTPCELLPQGNADRIRDAALVLHAADAFGAAQRCLDLAVRYAGERVQFGRPIGSFQALKHQLANAATLLEPSRALWWYAAHAQDAVPADASRIAALAKAHVTDVAVRVGRAAVEAHGGIGYTWQYPLHVWL